MYPKINKEWLDTHKWGLRSSNNGISHKGFQWKRKWAWNTCPDWNNLPKCGGGFHFNTPKANGYGFDYSRLELHEVRGEGIIIDGDKEKFPESRAVAYNEDIPVEAFEQCGLRLAKDGDTITNKRDIVIGKISVNVYEDGRCWYPRSDSVVNVHKGGECRYARYNSTVNVYEGGECRYALSGSVVNVHEGGKCRNPRSGVIVNVHKGGECRDAESGSVINVYGGECWDAQSDSIVNVYRGGECLYPERGAIINYIK